MDKGQFVRDIKLYIISAWVEGKSPSMQIRGSLHGCVVRPTSLPICDWLAFPEVNSGWEQRRHFWKQQDVQPEAGENVVMQQAGEQNAEQHIKQKVSVGWGWTWADLGLTRKTGSFLKTTNPEMMEWSAAPVLDPVVNWPVEVFYQHDIKDLCSLLTKHVELEFWPRESFGYHADKML